MTTINDIADIARILREQPEWKDTIRGILLSQELLELPERFADFVQITNRNFQLVYERQDRLETDIAEFVQITNRNFQLVYEGLDRLETAQTETNQRLDRLETGVSALNTRMNRMEGKLDNSMGTNYERKVAKNIYSLMGSLNLRRTHVLKGYLVGMSREFADLVDDAEDDGLITAEQNNEVMWVDLVCLGRNRYNGSEQYVAGEISITIGSSDITRAAQRAAILSSVVGHTVQPAVFGAYIDDERTALAASQGVAVLPTPNE